MPLLSLQMRFLPFALCLTVLGTSIPAILLWPQHAAVLLVLILLSGSLAGVGFHDLLQKNRSILRNYPVIGHLRFMLESIRPELRQYFFESDLDGAPFSREQRAVVYQRAKGQLDKKPFGTLNDVYGTGYEWMLHSLWPVPVSASALRLGIGGPDCLQPYDSSILNISAMSFGALSANAIRALNAGAKAGNFAHDTGEGSISPYHLEAEGDLIWEIGSGYFGCRTLDGAFSDRAFVRNAALPQVKMIEIKLNQGAKPGHGGVLPAAKVTPEIAAIRGVPLGRDCVSPAKHSEFSTPGELMHFIARLRVLSDGKPVGFKICPGRPEEVRSLVRAMLDTGITPDFIVVDGKEGGTGAAPVEFIDNIGMPLRDGLTLLHGMLVEANIRSRLRIGAAGKIVTGFDMARTLALGADWCNAARAFMFSLGCVQAQACHTGRCPTGIATQDTWRQRGLDVENKAQRVATFHRESVQSLAELLAASGHRHPSELSSDDFFRRGDDGRAVRLSEFYPDALAPEMSATRITPPSHSRRAVKAREMI